MRMPVTSLLLVVAAAVIHATWNLLAKRAAHAGTAFVAAYNLVAFVAYAPWAIWTLLQGGMDWSLPVALCLAASGLIHLVYSLVLQRGYRAADLSVVYPVARGTGPLLSALAAILILGEWPGLRGLAGLAAVVCGILLIATGGSLRAFRRADGRTGVLWGGATGGLIATYTVVDGYGVKVLGIAPIVLDWASNALRFVLLIPMVVRDPGRARIAMRGHWPLAVAVGLLSPLGYILVLGALQAGAPLSLVAPMREMSMMLVALFGMILLKEPVGPGRIAGCAAVVLGVVLLASA
jgi:drug/metabolite transporter (DMT)-like permease